MTKSDGPRENTGSQASLRRAPATYARLVADLGCMLAEARQVSARAVNAVMTATYWEFGRRIVDFEQRGAARADYGARLLSRLAHDLTRRHGRGFSLSNLQNFRAFYLLWPIHQTASGESSRGRARPVFGLPWSHYVRLLTVKDCAARRFYEAEALRDGWSVRQLDRQIATAFHERTLLSRARGNSPARPATQRSRARLGPEDEIKHPLVLEFLDLHEAHSESDLEEALLLHLEKFLLELGGDFAFVGRQRRLRIGAEWYRVDLLFFHRRLRCLVVIDLKIGRLTHADTGQMNVYLNYASRHWRRKGENLPVGLILCSEQDEALAQYALKGMGRRILTREYRLALPPEAALVEQLQHARLRLEVKAPR